MDYSSKLYLFDSYLNEYITTIQSIELLDSSSSSNNNNNKYGTHKIILNKTIFHPQGGGQPSSIGIIMNLDNNDNNNLIFQVNYVNYNANENYIEHYGIFLNPLNTTNTNTTTTTTETETNSNDNSNNNAIINPEDYFFPGKEVLLKIDLDIRKLHMKLHSSGHVIDAAVKRTGYWTKLKAGKGYHFPDGPYVEYIGELTEEEITNLPNLLNNEIKIIIEENIPSKFHMLSKEEAGVLCECDTTNYPDIVRVVEIAGHSCPCGGTHISNTLELGDLKVTRIKKKKKNIKISYEVGN